MSAVQPISKSEFARRRNVTPARVSQWISEGKIHGAAIVGLGRGALIDEVAACQQLDRALDVDQRHSANGLATNLEPATPAVSVAPEGPSERRNVTDEIARERLALLRHQNGRAALSMAVEAGRLVDADAARRAAATGARRIVNLIEGALPEVASDIAAKFKLPQRDVLHALRHRMRTVREHVAQTIAEEGSQLPATGEFDLSEFEATP